MARLACRPRCPASMSCATRATRRPTGTSRRGRSPRTATLVTAAGVRAAPAQPQRVRSRPSRPHRPRADTRAALREPDPRPAPRRAMPSDLRDAGWRKRRQPAALVEPARRDAARTSAMRGLYREGRADGRARALAVHAGGPGRVLRLAERAGHARRRGGDHPVPVRGLGERSAAPAAPIRSSTAPTAPGSPAGRGSSAARRIPDRLLPPKPDHVRQAEENEARSLRERPPWGVNVAGFFRSELGLGEAARLLIAALDAVRVPALPMQGAARSALAPERPSSASEPPTSSPYPITSCA